MKKILIALVLTAIIILSFTSCVVNFDFSTPTYDLYLKNNGFYTICKWRAEDINKDVYYVSDDDYVNRVSTSKTRGPIEVPEDADVYFECMWDGEYEWYSTEPYYFTMDGDLTFIIYYDDSYELIYRSAEDTPQGGYYITDADGNKIPLRPIKK